MRSPGCAFERADVSSVAELTATSRFALDAYDEQSVVVLAGGCSEAVVSDDAVLSDDAVVSGTEPRAGGLPCPNL
jgi:hypothetical protein